MNFKLSSPQGEWEPIKFITNLYIDKFNTLPSITSGRFRVELSTVQKILSKNFSFDELIFESYYTIPGEKNLLPNYALINLENDSYVHLSICKEKNKFYVTYMVAAYRLENQKKVHKMFQELNDNSKPEPKNNRINIVVDDRGSYSLKSFEIKKPKFKLEENYDGLDSFHNNLIKRLNKKEDKGIALFYGSPGCGKSNYIRYLLALVKKTVIYLPPDMAAHISSPSFVNFLMGYPDSVLVIEDAENVIKKRDSGTTQSISNLLNLGDGLLSDVLHIQIVATFNCSYTDIDEALLRKGRLICKHEFGKLSIEKAQYLSDRLGFKTTILEPTSLSDIYNQDDKSYKTERKKIGFNF